MARAPYILARTLKEAHEFAREELGLGRGQYRPVHSPSTVSSVRGADLYLVPGYEKRVDRFAMKGALRYTRLNLIEHTPAEAPPVLDGLNPPGEQLSLVTDEEVQAFFEVPIASTATWDTKSDPLTDLVTATGLIATEGRTALSPEEIAELESKLEPAGWEPPATLDADQILRLAAGETGAEVAPTEVPVVKRRRRRCDDCGILVDPDEVEQHKSEHLPTDS